jgi:hypothetical protein
MLINAIPEMKFKMMEKYSLAKKVRSGAYRHVWKVTDQKTTQRLALKKIFQNSINAQRTLH